MTKILEDTAGVEDTPADLLPQGEGDLLVGIAIDAMIAGEMIDTETAGIVTMTEEMTGVETETGTETETETAMVTETGIEIETAIETAKAETETVSVTETETERGEETESVIGLVEMIVNETALRALHPPQQPLKPPTPSLTLRNHRLSLLKILHLPQK